MIYDLGNFDVLIQSGLWAIRKITFANLYKAIHNAIIFPVSSELLNMETVKEKEKITKNEIPAEWKELFRWNKNQLS